MWVRILFLYLVWLWSIYISNLSLLNCKEKKILPAIPFLTESSHQPLQLPTDRAPEGNSGWRKTGSILCFGCTGLLGDEGDTGKAISISRSGRIPGRGNGNPLQYCCLENSMDRLAWQDGALGVTKSRTRLSTRVCFSQSPPTEIHI